VAAGRRKSNLSEPLLDAFCDALWLEDGLAKNSIASYRAVGPIWSSWPRF